jgi:hypothetical protein
MICDEDRVLGFLFEDLEESERTAFDEHLLGCERCWTAVIEDRRGRALAEALREPAPAGLADRVRLAGETRRRAVPLAPSRQRQVALLAGAASLVAVVLVGVVLAVVSTPARISNMAATTAAVRLGSALPDHFAGPPMAHPEQMAPASTMTVGGVQLTVTYFRVDSGEAILAHSSQPFAMPAGATRIAGGAAWTAEMGGMAIYCDEVSPAAVVVTPMPAGAATELAAYLGMPTS